MRSCSRSWMTCTRRVDLELFTHANIRLHHGKTQVWNRGDARGYWELTQAARRVKPDAVVWKGDSELPHAQQGLKVLGVPIGQPEYVRNFLEKRSRGSGTFSSKLQKKNSSKNTFIQKHFRPKPFHPKGKVGWQQKATSWRRGSSETRCLALDDTQSSVAILARPSGIVTLHGTAHFKGDQDGRPTLPPVLVPTLTCPFLCLFVPAMAADLILLATIVQRALRQGCWAAGGFHWSVPPFRFAVRQENESPPTSSCGMDLAAFNALDTRRLEVVADGLTLWHGAQLATNTTLVSPLR